MSGVVDGGGEGEGVGEEWAACGWYIEANDGKGR